MTDEERAREVALTDEDVLDVCAAIKALSERAKESAAKERKLYDGEDKYFSKAHPLNGPYIARRIDAYERQAAFYARLWREIRDGRLVAQHLKEMEP